MDDLTLALQEKLKLLQEKNLYPPSQELVPETDLKDPSLELERTTPVASPIPPVSSPAPIDLSYGKGLSDADLAAAQSQQNKTQLISNLGQAADQINAGFSKGAFTPNPEFYQNLAKQAGQPISDILTRRKGKDEETKRKSELLEQASLKQKSDPNSDISKQYRQFAKELGFNVSPSASALELDKITPLFERAYYARMQKLERQESRDERMDVRAKEKLDKNIQDISTRYEKANVPQALETLQKIDGLMEGIDKDKKDLPGFGLLGGLTPDWATSKEGQQLRQQVQRLANIELKTRSGTAVTDPEYARFKKEFGTGTWTTEAQLRNGIRQYRDVLKRLTSEMRAGAAPEAVSEYESRPGAVTPEQVPGGASLQQQATSAGDKINVISPEGKKGSIPKNKLNEALQRGFKVL